MRLLVWHWGRRGAGPVFAQQIAQAAAGLVVDPVLSLAAGAEILAAGAVCDWVEPTYGGAVSFALQRLWEPVARQRVLRQIRGLRPDYAICAMPAMLDTRMIYALQRCRVPYAVIVHDAEPHRGESLVFRLLGQGRLLQEAQVLFALSSHVAAALRAQGFGQGDQTVARLWHPPLHFGAAPPPLAHGGNPRLLFFGRLLPYKGLDLLADALERFDGVLPFTLRIAGQGAETVVLNRLASIPGVVVERRWVPEAEIAALIGWADGIVLPYREASQSGIAAAAMAQGRYVLATEVGGLGEQLNGYGRALLCAPEAAAIAAGLAAMFQPRPLGTAPGDWSGMVQDMMGHLT